MSPSLAPTMSPPLFSIFAALVEDACGLHHGPHDAALFASKVQTQALEAGCDALLDYYYKLRYDDPSGRALQALVQALMVHETYFFRELGPLHQLVDTLLVPRVRECGAARIWSAACATGEEPLTLAMLLAERGILDRVEILATDLSELAITRARAGRHSRRALRVGHPAALAARYLEVTGDVVRVATALHATVRFAQLNLLDDAAIARLGVFDVVLCRNVLIYFQDAGIPPVVERLTRALAPGGLLAVGVAESLLRFGTALRCEERGGAFFYRAAA